MSKKPATGRAFYAAKFGEEAAEHVYGASRETTPDTHPSRVLAHGAVFCVYCDMCGPVGQPQTYEVDARAIADRHEGIGGCER